MAFKSLLLSLTLTTMLGYCLTAGLTNPASLLKKIQDWASFALIGLIFIGYLVSAWWAFKGFADHKWMALFSLGFCTLGISVYVVVLSMELGRGKASPGQYDYSFSRLEPSEQVALVQILEHAGLRLEDAKFSEHWHLSEKVPGFRICVQKGHITAMQFSDKSIPDLSLFSAFLKLEDLYLMHCGLADMSALHSDQMERLELPDNQIADLRTLAACPKLRWLNLKNNRLVSLEGLELFPELVSRDFSENPVTSNAASIE